MQWNIFNFSGTSIWYTSRKNKQQQKLLLLKGYFSFGNYLIPIRFRITITIRIVIEHNL